MANIENYSIMDETGEDITSPEAPDTDIEEPNTDVESPDEDDSTNTEYTLIENANRIANDKTKIINAIKNKNVDVPDGTSLDVLDTYIGQIEQGSAPVLQNKTITTNGTYTSDAGYDGLGQVDVNVPSEIADITDMAYFCYYGKRLQSLASLQSILKPTTLECCFENASFSNTMTYLNYIDTSNCTNFQYAFSNNSSLITANLKGKITNKCTTISDMFDDCTRLTTINFSNCDTSNVASCGYLFYNCTSLVEIDLNDFRTDKMSGFSNVFSGCSKLKKINNFTLDGNTSREINIITPFKMGFNKSTLLEEFNWKEGHGLYCTVDSWRTKSITLDLTDTTTFAWVQGFVDTIGVIDVDNYKYTTTRTIKFNTTTYNEMTEEQIETLEDKGYVVAYGTS